MLKLGPIGNLESGEWDEQGRTEIVQIFVSHDDRIHSLQFQYYENGSLVLSERRGRSSGSKFDVVAYQAFETSSKLEVKFNYPTEHLTCISGFKRLDHLASITFTTNLGTYGPFGPALQQSQEFRFQLGRDPQFGGFCGTSDTCVRSIGVYLKPITTLNVPGKHSDIPVEKDAADT